MAANVWLRLPAWVSPTQITEKSRHTMWTSENLSLPGNIRATIQLGTLADDV